MRIAFFLIMPTIQSLLEQKSDLDFITGLREIVDPNNATAIDDPPPPAAATLMMCFSGLYVYAGNDGLWKFLSDYPAGRHLPELVTWTKGIGAKKASAYCAAGVKLLPKKRVPHDEAFEDWIEKLEEKALARKPTHAFYGVDDLRRVDQEHEGALDDLAAALRTFASKNSKNLVGALEKVAAKAPPKPMPFAEPPKPKRKVKTTEPQTPAELIALVKARGDRRPDGKPDPRLVDFMKIIPTLSEKDWRIICDRWFETRNACLRAHFGTNVDEWMHFRKTLLPEKELKLHKEAAFRLRDKTDTVFAKLPEGPHRKGAKGKFQRVAFDAMNDVWMAFQHYDWYVVTPKGRQNLRAVAKRFEGYYKFPDEIYEK
jgi:hypothetical protein